MLRNDALNPTSENSEALPNLNSELISEISLWRSTHPPSPPQCALLQWAQVWGRWSRRHVASMQQMEQKRKRVIQPISSCRYTGHILCPRPRDLATNTADTIPGPLKGKIDIMQLILQVINFNYRKCNKWGVQHTNRICNMPCYILLHVAVPTPRPQNVTIYKHLWRGD